jgi:Uncharacterized conserved protein
MRNLKIGIMGCLVNSTNMGCIALTYSLLQNLDQIGIETNCKFQYIIFDEIPSEKKMNKLAKNLSIESARFAFGHVGAMQVYNLKGLIRAHTKMLATNMKMRSDVLKCDVVIDMTGGDSFSDIYGKERFYKQTAAKRFVEKSGIPLILGPQTYGPYTDEKVKEYARKTIESAYLVMARDDESKEYLEGFCHKEVVTVTDLAFGLSYQKQDSVLPKKIRVGINPSGLLGKNKIEFTKLDNKLKANYDQYIKILVDTLSNDERYEVHLIPHVGNEVIECFSGFDKVIYHEAFTDPIAAKSFISTMDVFIGSRMHATIGAFSAGVPTIPVAYSKKFFGLFHALGYDYVVDLQLLGTQEAIELTLSYLDKRDEIKRQMVCSDAVIKKKYSCLKMVLKNALNTIQ